MDRDTFLTMTVREVMTHVENTKAQDKIIKLIMTVYDILEEEGFDAKTSNSKLLHNGAS